MATVVTQTLKRYKDLDLNFNIHPVRKDINKFVDEKAVINSFKNLILLNHFEKPFHPEIGSNVRKMLFENMDSVSIQTLQNEIKQTITNFEPRITIESIRVLPEHEENRLNVEMTFYIVNRSEPISIQFFLNRER